MPKGFMYILQCSDMSFYTGSTTDIDRRLDDFFYREKQIQKWSKSKKRALIEGDHDLLRELVKSKNKSL